MKSAQELDGLARLKLQQLEYGRKSSLLVLTRDKNTQLIARKLKAEIGRVFVSSDAKDCIKLLTKHTNDAQDIITIDMVNNNNHNPSMKLSHAFLHRF
jgi:hypothetical protein